MRFASRREATTTTKAEETRRKRVEARSWPAESVASLVTRRRMLSNVGVRPGMPLLDLLNECTTSLPFSALTASDVACSLFVSGALQLHAVHSSSNSLFASARSSSSSSSSLSLHVFLHPNLSLYLPGAALEIQDTIKK